MANPTAAPDSAFCLRWREHRHSWRHVSEGGFDARQYEVVSVGELEAKAFVERHHYSQTYPAARLRYGLYGRGGGLLGVAVLSVPMRAAVLTTVFPALTPYAESLELGRFVLLDQVPANAESWFLAQLFHQAERDGLRGVVSFSDPVARARADGTIVFPGHRGTIYQASNAHYLGRSTARTLRLLPDGRVFSERAQSKLRQGERGHAYAARQLRASGVADPFEVATLRTLRHGGNYRYAFALGDRRERRSLTAAFPRWPYPKTLDQGGVRQESAVGRMPA